MHGKEKAMTPILKQHLGVIPKLVPSLDTDSLGTFTGEVERIQSPLETLRKKCELAITIAGGDLAIASEGSFGAHPNAFFAHANDELVMLIDTKNSLEIVARELTTDTNFNGCEIESEKQLEDFAKKAFFPSHAIILRNGLDRKEKIVKGIQDKDLLFATFDEILTEYGTVYAETDMRAMHNPTRMQVIAKATLNLMEKIAQTCPKCHTPGFSVTEVIAGLPCDLCAQPSRSTMAHIKECTQCRYSETIPFPNNKKTEDPMYCDYCNP